MSPADPQREGSRLRLRQRLNGLIQRRSHASLTGPIVAIENPGGTRTHAFPIENTVGSTVRSETATPIDQTNRHTEPTEGSIGGSPSDNTAPPATVSGTAANERSSTSTHEGVPTPDTGTEAAAVAPEDHWSKAYREAVQSMGEDVDVTILKGESIAQLFKELEAVDKDATEESTFLRGVRYFHSIQVPLERVKMVLDISAPLTALEPTTSAVFGVMRGVTALAISVATADLEFAKKIVEMLGQISYISDCDIIGQKEDRALVSVYQKLIEFYAAAYEFLSKRRAKLVLAVISDTGALPTLVQDISKEVENLRKIVEKATLDITQDIKTMMCDEKVSQLLGRDKRSQQSRLHGDLNSLRDDAACEFLLEQPQFKAWYRAPDYQQLVILGDMGSGKSVVMSFLIQELRRRAERQLQKPMVLYHYCQNDETGHALYIFSSLILSLLQQRVGLKKAFFDWYKQDLLSGNLEPSTNAHMLIEIFEQTVEKLNRPLFLIVDGLDECDAGSLSMLLQSLRSLSQKTPGLKVVLSSRPWEGILDQLEGSLKVHVGVDPGRDKVIVEKTVTTRLGYLDAGIQELVIERLSSLAQGSAIWTKMTVEAIVAKKIMARGRMKKFLDEMPQPRNLSKLYANLFIRCAGDEPEAQNMAAIALEVLGAARRRLSILELAWAVATGTADGDVTTVAGVAELVDYQGVMALIQPFVAVVNFDDLKKRQVIVAHQSVKEFILSDLRVVRPGFHNLESPTRSEYVILNMCIRYLLLDEINQAPLFSDEQTATEELPQDVDIFSDAAASPNFTMDCSWENWEDGMIRFDPADRGFGEFFVYASCNWINHFSSVTKEPLPDLGSIERLCQPNSTRLQNWTSQNSRPDCVVQARYEFDGSLYDPLSITSLYGSEVMLLNMLETSDLEPPKFLPNTAMLAAEQVLQWADLRRLRMLFQGRGTGCRLQNIGFFRRIIEWWRSPSINNSQGWDAAFDIINDIPEMLIRERWGNELLCLAASHGCMPIIKRLMKNAEQNVDLKEELLRAPQRQPRSLAHPAHQSIGEAALAGHVDVVRYLLEQDGIEGHLHHRNSKGENVLHLASEQCIPAIFRVLAPRFQEGLSQRDCQGRTALMRVVENSSTLQNHIESAEVLLSLSAADQIMLSQNQQDLLQMAEQMHDQAIHNLLTKFCLPRRIGTTQ
ncbi:hypothetical protein FGADI_4624 [Fusarium gaditjirri]|uniref:NACHT domain-containing protein n=1 Tax=Fusarium gaditjirri TaxID=282569 RepID=A0A8H4TCD8_9HYPO|nr:hypothetical protein FGADI_4624 [Fusarium gaditjirri]